MSFTRREFGKLALAALPATHLWPDIGGRLSGCRQAELQDRGGPDRPQRALQLRQQHDARRRGPQKCVQLGVSAVELRSQPVEGFLGAPAELLTRSGGRASTPEEQAARKRRRRSCGSGGWRCPWTRSRTFRKKYEDAGVLIEIVKFDGSCTTRADDEMDYCFNLAKALGAKAISCEISVPDTKRIGQFADKHKLMVGYHGHTKTGPARVGNGVRLRETQRRQSRHRPLRRRRQRLAARRSSKRTTIASRTCTSRIGRSNERGEHAVRRRRHARSRRCCV